MLNYHSTGQVGSVCHRCAGDSESEEIRAEIRTVNNLSDSELRVQLQKSNDETYERRAQPSECAECADVQ